MEWETLRSHRSNIICPTCMMMKFIVNIVQTDFKLASARSNILLELFLFLKQRNINDFLTFQQIVDMTRNKCIVVELYFIAAMSTKYFKQLLICMPEITCHVMIFYAETEHNSKHVNCFLQAVHISLRFKMQNNRK